MALSVVFDLPGVTAEQYDAVIAGLEAAGEAAPAGRLHHVAAATETGWLVVDTWESPEHLERFAGVLMPIMGRAGIQGEPKVYPAHNVISG